VPSSGTTIAEALACGRPGCSCASTARRGSGLTHCPGHPDAEPSLAVTYKGGKVLVHCQAGCSQQAVIAALQERGLWTSTKGRSNGKPVAVYPYHDEEGHLLFEVAKYPPKRFKQRHPDGNGGYVYNLDGVRRVLYRLPELLAADPTEFVYIPEGEKHVDRLRSLGFIATTNAGGAKGWRSEYADSLAGRRLAILSDNDEPGREHERDIIASVYGVAADVRVVALPDLGEHGDVLDWLDAGGTAEKLRELTEAAPRWEPEPVPDGAALLDDVVTYIRKYVVLAPQQADAEALWTAHTHAIDAADCTPYLHITSPEKRSGKTKNEETLEPIVKDPWLTGHVTAAVLIRRIQRDAPTMLLDESDAAFKVESEYTETLRAVLNCGHRRGMKTSLCVKSGAGFDLVDFETFCPKAIAGIGRLPDTVADRSIRIELRRRAPNEPVARFRRREVEAEALPLRERLERWAAAHLDGLRNARPSIPAALDDRAADGWEALLSIADAAGGHWPQRARGAALALSCGDVRDDDSLHVQLLSDIRGVFEERDLDRLSSAELVAYLNAIEESPWGDYKNKPLDPRRLGWLLKPFGVKPTKTRDGDSTSRHYQRWAFDDAWARYCISPEKPEQVEQPERELDSDSADVPVVTDVPVSTGIQERASPLVQAALDMGAVLVEPEPSEPAEVRCHVCGGIEFYFRADGTGPVCARCHPQPPREVRG